MTDINHLQFEIFLLLEVFTCGDRYGGNTIGHTIFDALIILRQYFPFKFRCEMFVFTPREFEVEVLKKDFILNLSFNFRLIESAVRSKAFFESIKIIDGQ